MTVCKIGLDEVADGFEDGARMLLPATAALRREEIAGQRSALQEKALASADVCNENERMAELRIGPAGWNYRNWKGVFYPARTPRGFSQLEYLAEYFDAAEINTSFYGPFSTQSATKWIQEVKANERFVFTAKLLQKFTQFRNANAADERAVREGFDVLQNAGKLGAVLLQFPFSFHNTAENVRTLNGIIEKFRAYPLVVEVRHASWDTPKAYEFLRERGVGFCNIDQPIIGRSLKPTANVTSLVGYVRFHGRNAKAWFSDDPTAQSSDRYDYLYSVAEIKPWIDRIAEIAKKSKSVFVITNNSPAAKCMHLGTLIMALYLRRRVKMPEPMIDRYPELKRIAIEPPQKTTLF
jgi:uncharacterized protein YecE (DUF72 family)